MRTIAVLSIAVVAMLVSSVTADAGAWCATYRRGVENCGYSSFEQCRATVSGLPAFLPAESVPGHRVRDRRHLVERAAPISDGRGA